MTAIDCFLALRHRLPSLYGSMAVESFADRLAYDYYNNGFQKRIVGSSQEDIVADALTVDDQQQQTRFIHPTLAFDQISINVGAVVNTSPITLDASAFNFQMRPIEQEYHDCVSYRVKDASGHASKRRCSICGSDTRMECSNPRCRKVVTWRGGQQYFGVMVCNPRTGVRTTLAKQNLIKNTKTCLELHQEECNKQSGK
jgi:hypothetical protein